MSETINKTLQDIEELSTTTSQGVATSNTGAIDENNSTITPLGAGGVFTGTATNTLKYSAITILVKSDTEGVITIQFSIDGIDWHDGEQYTILANTTKFYTPPIQAKYYRIYYTNGDTPQTYFHLHATLKVNMVKGSSHNINETISGQDDAELMKAVITGESTSEDGTFVNGKFTPDGSQLVKLADSQNTKEIYITPTRELKTTSICRLAGTAFNGVKDTNFWAETVTGTGSVTAGGQITLATGTTANSTAKYTSVRKGRYVPSNFNQFRGIAQTSDAGVEGNTRRIGAYSDQDGFFYQISGTTFAVGSRKAGVDTLVESGSFNGNLGASYELDTSCHRLYIDYGNLSVYFYVDDILLHRITQSATPATNTLTFPITFENINEDGLDDNISFNVRTSAIIRLGNLHTNPAYKYINTNTTTVCKYGAGALHKIVISDDTGNINIYDGVTAVNPIALIDVAKNGVVDLAFEAPFSDGLTIVTSGGAKLTVVYE